MGYALWFGVGALSSKEGFGCPFLGLIVKESCDKEAYV